MIYYYEFLEKFRRFDTLVTEASTIQPRFARHRLSLILSSRILTLSAAHTTSASSAKPMMLDPAGWSMRRTSSPTCRSDRHLSFATGSLEPFSSPSPRFRCSTFAVLNALRMSMLINAQNPLRLPVSPCFSGDFHYCLDGVNCGPVFPKAELVFRETVLAEHVTL